MKILGYATAGVKAQESCPFLEWNFSTAAEAEVRRERLRSKSCAYLGASPESILKMNTRGA